MPARARPRHLRWADQVCPGPVIKTIFGDMGRALLLEGVRVLPRRLEGTGFRFQFPELDRALGHVLGLPRAA